MPSDAQIIAKANKILADSINEQTKALKYTNALLRALIVEKKSAEQIIQEKEEEPTPDDVVRERVRSVADNLKRVADSLDNVPTIDKKVDDA